MRVKITSTIFAAVFFATTALLPTAVLGQSNQLMLADIVIALRSKKATLTEKNEIIAKAIAARGVTFALTPEIEKELVETGADNTLLDSIRQKSTVIKIAAVSPAPVETKPKPVEPAPDFLFYQKRGDASLVSGDNDAAIADYSKSIEMKADWIGSYLGRATAYAAKKNAADALHDYDKVIELKPDHALAQFKRAELLEQKGDIDLALTGYNKAFELDPANTTARAAADRITAERKKALEKVVPVEPTPVTVAPEFVDLGPIPQNQVIDLVKPIYPQTAARLSISGRVVVDIVLDTDGKVVSAKANSGPPILKQAAEEAAARSKFKPATYKGAPIKSKGYVSYSFATAR